MTGTLLSSAASGTGLATYAGEVLLDVWYPAPALSAEVAPAPELAGPELASLERHDPVRDVRTRVVHTVVADLSVAPTDTADVWLRLHLLSHRLVRPRQISVEGFFAHLTNVAWTSLGPVAVPDLAAVRLRALAAGQPLTVYGVDKFPRMVDYVVPDGVRIADADRVRLGAHLASGTTVMHEGFVNFNAGTLGASMIEGRVSAGVVVGEGSDVGGGASIMGTLSGGGTQVVTIGRGCLIGANSGVGISLGDGCVIEAGCYITAGSKITLPDGEVAKGRDLSGVANLQYWRNSLTGALEARPRSGPWGGLNTTLHTVH